MLNDTITKNLIGIKDIIIKEIHGDDEMINIIIEMPKKEHKCPVCEAATDFIHDYRTQKVKDLPSFGKNVILILRKRRYRCRQCNKRFYEENSFLPRYHRMTSRLCAFVIHKLREVYSFTSVAKEVNLSVSTVIRIFDLVKYTNAAMPKVLSIDEFKGNTGVQKYQCILTDPADKRVLDVLPTRKKEDLMNYFSKFERTATTHFVSDMWDTYADIHKICFKRSSFIIDKYHFIRQVIWAFEAVRKEEQKKFSAYRRKYFKRNRILLNKRYKYLTEDEKEQVNQMLSASSRLLCAYSLKENFYEFTDCKTRNEAQKQLSAWIVFAQNSQLERFIICALTFQNWSEGILNSFSYPYTNGYTEGCNNKIKVLKRNAYGYRNFTRFRNRILHIFA